MQRSWIVMVNQKKYEQMEKKIKLNEAEFKEFMNTLVDSFDKEYLESPMFKHFFENLKYFENPDEFQSMVLHPIKRAIELVLENKFNKNKNTSSLYFQYDFLENNVSQLCSQFYGSGCSVDKGRSLVKAYIRWKETGKMPKFDWKGKYTFHYPETGTEEQWMKFIDGVYRLKYGYNKEYLLALKELMNAKKTKEVIKREKKDLEEYYKRHPEEVNKNIANST